MDELLPDEIPAIRTTVRRFMEKELVPALDEFEERCALPRALIRKAGDAGFYGAAFPESVGGTNLGFVAAVAILEEISRIDIRFAGCSNQQGGNCPACIYLAGTEHQIQKFRPDILGGRMIGMMALTEAGSGSDAAGSMRTVAVRDGDVYRITGSKMWATPGNECDVGVLFAKTNPEAGTGGISAFIAEDALGYKPADRHHGKTGLRDMARSTN